jgi:predicted 3-demethylubiquinone-9 3-methyltransferase (glyoxalase superfamily)
MKQKITPNLWFDGNAEEATEFYVSAFPGSKIVSRSYYPNSAEEGLADFQLNLAGQVLTVEFELARYHEDTGSTKQGSLMVVVFKITNNWLTVIMVVFSLPSMLGCSRSTHRFDSYTC